MSTPAPGLDPVTAAFHRRLKLNIILAASITAAFGLYGAWTAGRAAAGYSVDLAVPLTLAVFTIMAAALGVTQAAVLLGEQRNPRVNPIPAAPGHLTDTINAMIATYTGLSSAQLAQLDGAHRTLARGRLHELTVERALRTAGWAGRLYHDGRQTGLIALQRCQNHPAVYEAMLAVLVADACHPRDFQRLTNTWRALRLPLPGGSLPSWPAAHSHEPSR